MTAIAPTTEARAGSPSGWPRRILPVGLIAIAACVIYAPAITGEWLWDDALELTQNAQVTGGSLAEIWLAPAHTDYFPLKTTVQWLGWRLWGAHVVGWHLLNLALHVLGGLLVWRLLGRLGLRSAWLGGLLFVVHPLAVESVAWMAELKNTLSLPPLLLSACAYIEYTRTDRKGRYAAAIAWFVVSLLGKTSGVMLPVGFLLYHAWEQRRIAARHLRAAAPFFLVALGFGLLTIHFQHSRAIAETAVPIGGAASRVALAGMALWFYLGKFFLPVNLVPIYRPWSIEPPAAAQFLPWAALAVVVFVCWRRRAAWGRPVLLAGAAFAALVAPVLGFVPMSYMRYSWVADHFVYLPMIALVALVTAGIDRLRATVRARGVVAACLVIGLGALAILSRRHAGVFRNEREFWTHSLRHYPEAWVAHDGLGRVRQAEGALAEAEAHFEKAIALNPRSATAHNNLATLRTRQGRAAEALPLLETAVKLDPKFAGARSNLGNALLQLRRGEEAIAAYREALRLNPSFVEARNNLGNALFLAGRPQDAVEELRRTIATNPAYPDAHHNLGKILLRLGRTAEAVTAFDTAARLTPRNPVVQNDLGYALLIAGRAAEAAARFEAAVRLKPDYVDALTNLAGVRYHAGDVRSAIAHYEAALRIDPQAADARRNLELIRQEQAATRPR